MADLTWLPVIACGVMMVGMVWMTRKGMGSPEAREPVEDEDVDSLVTCAAATRRSFEQLTGIDR